MNLISDIILHCIAIQPKGLRFQFPRSTQWTLLKFSLPSALTSFNCLPVTHLVHYCVSEQLCSWPLAYCKANKIVSISYILGPKGGVAKAPDQWRKKSSSDRTSETGRLILWTIRSATTAGQRISHTTNGNKKVASRRGVKMLAKLP